ncbi:retrovirus-related pol polyprotein from transposon TNT 1-94 [Tanacetum coccineum]
MDQDSAHMVAASKVPMLKPGEYEIWRMMIEQYIQMIDYALWEVIENGATLPKTKIIKGVMTEMLITTAKEKAQRRLKVKARSTLMIGIPNEHQLKFNSIKRCEKLLGVPPPLHRKFHASKPDLSFTGLEEFVNKHVVENCKDYVLVKKSQSNPQMDLHDQGVIDSGCSRHMTGSMSCLIDYEEIDGGYVAFGGNPKGGKIGIEAVNIACYVQNRVLVVKPHNKTPYELFHGRTPALSFMRPFGCPVTILNTIDHLGKFDGKADEGFFVRYSLNSKAFRVFVTPPKWVAAE